MNALVIILVLALAGAAPVAAQEPRLPPPAYPGATLESLEAQLKLRPTDDLPVDAQMLRARLLSQAGRFRESADIWSAVGAREPLLAQASDWAFLIKNGTAKDYAARRVTDHLVRFRRLQQQLTSNQVDKKFLSECERCDNLFPKVNWRYYI